MSSNDIWTNNTSTSRSSTLTTSGIRITPPQQYQQIYNNPITPPQQYQKIHTNPITSIPTKVFNFLVIKEWKTIVLGMWSKAEYINLSWEQALAVECMEVFLILEEV